MTVISQSLSRLWRALFLQPAAYEEMREDNNPFVEGLFLIAAVGLAVALARLIGDLLEWASSPQLSAVQEVVYRNLLQMPWYQTMFEQAGQPFAEQFRQQYEWGWRVLPRLLGAPDPGMAAFNLLLFPLGLIVSWLIYGLLAHIVARLLGGEGTLAQTLGTTALAVAPQLFNLAELFPALVVGGVVGAWMLLCRYMGLRVAHDLSWPRALIATLAPGLILSLLIGLLVAAGLALAIPILPVATGGSR